MKIFKKNKIFRSKIAIWLMRISYNLDPKIDIFKNVIIYEDNKQYQEARAKANILISSLFFDHDKFLSRLQSLSREEINSIAQRAEELYVNRNTSVDPEVRKVSDKAWYVDIALEEYFAKT